MIGSHRVKGSDPCRAGVDPVALGTAILALALYLASELYLFSGRLALPLDDSWIHLQFARQIAAGEGLAYNPGEWVAGSTAPLWTALAALLFALPISPLWGVKLLGAAFYLVTVDATGRLAAELGLGRGPQRLAAMLVAASHWLVWSALSGMEVHLFTSASLWGLILHLRERRRRPSASLAVLALACLARPEGFLLLAAALADRLATPAWRRELAGLLPALGAAFLVIAPTLVFYRLIGDSFLPTTFAVKSAPDPDLLPNGRYLRTVLGILFSAQPVMLIFAGAGVLRLLERRGTARDRGLLLAFWGLGLPLAYSLLAADRGPVIVGNFGRYFFPLLPVVVLLGILPWERLGRRLDHRAALALAVLALVPQVWGLATGAARYTQTLANVEDSDVAAARWLADRLPPEAVLAVQDVGALKYLLPNRVIDLTGIVNPEILPHLRGPDPAAWEERLLRYLTTVEPAYLVVFPEFYPGLARTAGFRRIVSFPVRDNVTMAGDELVIFSTPWTGDRSLREGHAPEVR